MSISKEAIEAARRAFAEPCKSDDERALRLADELSNTGGDPHIPHWLPVILSALTTVRAEEREACAKVAERSIVISRDIAEYVAAAIRARKP